MKMVQGVFNGTGAALYVCCGFVPDEVRIVAVGDAEMATVNWGKGYRVAASVDGQLNHGGDQAVALYTAGTGVVPYEGGEVLSSSEQTSTGYGEGVYLGWDMQNYAQNSAYGYVSNPIDTWSLDTSGNRTGHFNDDVPASVSRIGAGSRILIANDGYSARQQWAVIESLTAGQGIAADEVTLSRALATGKVMYISGKYDMAPIALGKTTPKGFKLNATTDINVNDQIQSFVALQYDSP